MKSQIIEYIKSFLKLVPGGKQEEFLRWKLEHAKVLTHVKTDDIRKQYPQINDYLKSTDISIKQKECFKNAGQLCMYVDGVTYVEGEILLHGVPIEHAWNKIDGKYFDITKDILFPDQTDYDEYVSFIELDAKEFAHFMFKHKHWGGWIIEKFLKDKMIQENYYPRLFENPNVIFYNGDKIEWDDDLDNVITFGYSNNKQELYVAYQDIIHDDFPDGRGPCSGRIFYSQKLLTFWKFPEDKKELFKLLRDLEEKVNNDEKFQAKLSFDKSWKIEIPVKTDYEKEIKYNVGGWGTWHPKEGDIKYISINSYNKPYTRPKEELELRHLTPPAAGKKEVPVGFGSKSPEYQIKRAWQMANPASEGVADKYAEREFYIQDPDVQFEKKFREKQLEKKFIETKHQITDRDKIVAKRKINDNFTFYIVKNPTSLKKFDSSVRAIITKNGDLYVGNSPYKTHTIDILVEEKILKDKNDEWWHKLPVDFVTIQRVKDKDAFVIGESNEPLTVDSLSDHWKEKWKERYNIPDNMDIRKKFYNVFIRAARIKNPQFVFYDKLYGELKNNYDIY